MWPLKTIMYFSLFWVACLAALFNPIWGVVNYMMAYQTNPPVTWWGKPLLATGMRFSLLAAIFTLIGFFLARKKVPKIRPVLSLWELGELSLLLLAVFGIFLGIGYESFARGAFEKFWKLHVFVLVIARLATTRRNMQLMLWAIVMGSFHLGYDAYTAPASAFWRGRLTVFGGPDISTSSGAAAHLTAMLPIIGVIILITKSWPMRILAASSAAFTFNAVVLCRTRSAFVGVLFGLLAALLMAPKPFRFRVRALMVAGVLMAFSLTDIHYWERMATMSTRASINADKAATSRFDIWIASADILSDYPLGVGLGNFPKIIGYYDARYANRSPHNTIVVAFTELGVLGGLIFLAVIMESFRLVYRSSRMAVFTEHPLEVKLLSYGFLVSLVTYIVSGLGTERFSCESFWWVLVFPLCLYRRVVSEVEARETMPEPALVRSPVSEYVMNPGLRYGY